MKYPSYLEAFQSGKLQQAADKAFDMLESCCICPRKCKVNRKEDKRVFVKPVAKPEVLAVLWSHQGEEPPISGKNGSGTIFFSQCKTWLVFIARTMSSARRASKEVGPEELAGLMLQLQEMKCHNINFGNSNTCDAADPGKRSAGYP